MKSSLLYSEKASNEAPLKESGRMRSGYQEISKGFQKYEFPPLRLYKLEKAS
ncbi:hypothetical protein J2TS4_54590 [Paenibacillus sp. J2TS4]|nr:hypothetical protein J2TS4_54590 [Paenibacillus sp. J2TS4]